MPLPVERVRRWIFDRALPVWGQNGVDLQHGGFFEELAHNGAATDCTYKRLRTMCRQIYVFSHASALGWAAGDELSQRGFEFVMENARLPDGGWARRLSRSGDVIDPTSDLYDLSFVIFAFAWRYRATGDEECRRQARATIEFIHDRMRAPGGGFLPALGETRAREQNPHMHLAEACLAAFSATQDEVYLETADEVVRILDQRFFDGRSLGERFAEDWRRIGAKIEPGHHFEWAWILSQYLGIRGDRQSAHAETAAKLVNIAERLGVGADNAVYDWVNEDGGAHSGTSRLWPNTERIKAHLGMFELTGRDPTMVLNSVLELLWSRYFANASDGLWIDQFDEQGRPLTHATPASCVYHVFLAFTEILRLQDQIAAESAD